MTTSDDGSTYCWHDIEEHRLTLWGIPSIHGAVQPSVTLVARSVLSHAGTLHTPDAIDFDTEIRLPDNAASESLHFRSNLGFWDSLTKLRADLAEFRSGASNELTVTLTVLTLQFYAFCNELHPLGAACINGTLSNVRDSIDPIAWPYAKRPDSIIGWVSGNQTHAYRLHFAFLMSLEDPAPLDAFIQELDRLIAYLQNQSVAWLNSAKDA